MMGRQRIGVKIDQAWQEEIVLEIDGAGRHARAGTGGGNQAIQFLDGAVDDFARQRDARIRDDHFRSPVARDCSHMKGKLHMRIRIEIPPKPEFTRLKGG
jgi:hypothetical protein